MPREERRSGFFDAVSFSGCGTLNFYQTGVAAVLQERGLLQGATFTGTSAGAGLATLVAAGVDANRICEEAVAILKPHAGKNIVMHPQVLVSFADRFLEALVTPDTLEQIGDRVHIAVTRLRPWSSWSVHQFFDTNDLCRAIRASCHIPSLKRPYVRFRGKACLDGGLTCNSPTVGERCLRVSPFFFSRNIDIRPRSALNPGRAVRVPTASQAKELFALGRADAEVFIDRS